MRLLLDTHTLLWIVTDDEKLGKKAKLLYLDNQNDIYLSIASIWEMAIKTSLNKLELGDTLENFVAHHIKGNNIRILNIGLSHLYKIENLPFHHRDPFDRLIIAQSMAENYPILSSDNRFDLYPVNRIW